MNRWPIQENALRLVREAIAEGHKRLVLTMPTGTGKTLVATDLATEYLDQGENVVLYTNRKTLFSQLSKELRKVGIGHTRRAAGYEWEYANGTSSMALSSLQTEASRVLRKKTNQVHDAKLVIVDEGHLFTKGDAQAILDQHLAESAVVVYVTATPLGMGGVADKLLVAGNVSDGRACGALVWARHFAPDEPDWKRHKALRDGHLPNSAENSKIMKPQIMCGRVLEQFQKLNPDQLPTILFASDVKASIYWAQEFTKVGVRAAHIDGECVWVDGEFYRSDARVRDQVLSDSKDGTIKVLCNRFVLREGINAPWLAHGIFATVFGSLQAYIQSGGRLLRSFPDLEHVTVQDHGGNWHRHGSLNADRDWQLNYTDDMMLHTRWDGMRNGQPEPGTCPQCGMVIYQPKCRNCGWESKVWKVSRTVMEADGTLREQTGKVYKPKHIDQRPDGPKLWERVYWASRKMEGSRSFRSAFAVYSYLRLKEHGYGAWPNPSWPLMPKEYIDQFELVADVPFDRLNPKGDRHGQESSSAQGEETEARAI